MDHVVSLDQFLELQAHTECSPTLQEKAEVLLRDHECFRQDLILPPPPRDTGRRNHTWNRGQTKVYEAPRVRPEKIKIGNRDLSRESIARKDFLALMNKLTTDNKTQIQQTLKHVFREDCLETYLQVMWDQMRRAPEFHGLHLDILHTIRALVTTPELWAQKWMLLWEEFVATKKWVPSPEILQEEDYDEFCDFVKWRKHTLASLQAWKLLSQHKWIPVPAQDVLVPELCAVCEQELHLLETGNKCTDVYLDQLMVFVPQLSPLSREALQSFVDRWFGDDGARLRPSTRFKMLDIREKMEAKMKPAWNNNKRR